MPSTPSREDSAARPFLFGLVALAVPFVALCLLVASREWFKNDDFVFLASAQQDDWSWLRVFFPAGEGRYWSYRPVGLDGFFRVAQQLFGTHAPGFLAVSLTARFLGGAALYRLARQLGFGVPAAAATALLSVSRPPSMTAVWWAVGFCYTGPVFFGTVSLTLFVDALRGRGGGFLVASLFSFAAALLCHEVSVVFAGVAGLLALLEARRRGDRVCTPATLVRAGRQTAWHIGLAIGYVVLRSTQVGDVPQEEALYALDLGVDRVLKHATLLLGQVLGGEPAGTIWALSIGGLAALALAFPVGRRDALSWYGPIAIVGLLWLIATLIPFSVLAFAHLRFGVLLETPMALLAGGIVELAHRAVPETRRRWLETAVLLGLLAAMPYPALWTRANAPGGRLARQLVEVLDARGDLPEEGRIVLLYGSEGLADFRQARRFRSSTFGAGVLRATHPDKRLSLDFLHLAQQEPSPRLLCADCLFLTLSSELEISEAEPTFVVERVWIPALASSHRKTFQLAARRLALALGGDAIGPLLEACSLPVRKQAPDVCFQGITRSLRGLGTPRGEEAAWALIAARAARPSSAPATPVGRSGPAIPSAPR